MKILFLDIDGVLNPFLHYSTVANFHKMACNHIRTMLIKVPDLRIVVSSNWRLHGLEAIRDILKSNGIDPISVIDITPPDGTLDSKHNDARDHHIIRWLAAHPDVTDYVIIDDDMEMPDMKNKYVQTNGYVGFTQTDMDKALKILNADDKIH
jgi:hypothetical protein